MKRLAARLASGRRRARAGLDLHQAAGRVSAIVGLLVVVGAVGLADAGRGQSRAAEDLVKLQRKIAAYRQIQHDTTGQLYSVASALLVPDERTLERRCASSTSSATTWTACSSSRRTKSSFSAGCARTTTIHRRRRRRWSS